MKLLFFTSLILFITHFSITSFANQYRWQSNNCTIRGTQQDSNSKILSLETIYINFTGKYLLDDDRQYVPLESGYTISKFNKNRPS